MDVGSTNSLHTVQCTRCVSYVSVICVYGAIFILCFGCAAAVLDCSCATGCNINNVCDTPQTCERRNMALGRPATITSLWNSTRYNETSGPACLAVNGNTDTVFRPINQFPDSPNCVHTAENSAPSYWEVDLGRLYDIDSITVYAREYSEYLLETTSIKVDNKTCYTISTETIFTRTINKADIKCETPQRGQKIQLYKESGLLMFCEVQVWVACGSSQPCAYCGHCKDNTDCDRVSRNCIKGCDPGWTGMECDNGCNYSYGINCSKTCGNCLRGTPCLPDSGICVYGCIAGYQPPYCNEICRNKTYGVNCSLPCGNCDNSMDCDIYSGTCQTCASNFLLPYCKDCVDGYYGTDCKETCGHCKNNVSCATNTGLCPEGCEGSWQGDNCKQASSQSDDTDRVSASCAGPVAGAVVGSCAVCTLGFVLAILLMRYRHRHGQDKRPSAAYCSENVQTDILSSEGAGRLEPELPMNNETSRVSTNLYDSLTASRDKTSTYTTLTVKRAGDVRSSPYANTT